MKKLIIYFLLFFLLVVTVFGVKPVNTVILPEAGLFLTVNSYNVYPTNTNLELFVHVFNDSNGLRIWNRTGQEVDCDNDVYLPNGSIYVEQTGVWDGNELKLSLNGVSTPGIYSYEVYCNTSKRGGELLNYFEVTEKGYESDNASDLRFNLIIASSILSLILLYFAFNLSKEHGILQILNILFAVTFLMFIPLSFFLTALNTNNILWRFFLGYYVLFWIYIAIFFFKYAYEKLISTVKE